MQQENLILLFSCDPMKFKHCVKFDAMCKQLVVVEK